MLKDQPLTWNLIENMDFHDYFHIAFQKRFSAYFDRVNEQSPAELKTEKTTHISLSGGTKNQLVPSTMKTKKKFSSKLSEKTHLK